MMRVQSAYGRRTAVSLAVFVLGAVVTLLALTSPVVQQLFAGIERSGYSGMVLAGILYAMAFTATSATILVAHAPAGLSLPLAAVLGGLGALAYDVVIFTFVRHGTRRGMLTAARTVLQRDTAGRHWLLPVLGFLILASPLPDELAAGLLGMLQMSHRMFLLLSFVANTLGILTILLMR